MAGEDLDPVYLLGEEELREVLEAAVMVLEEWGYTIDVAALVFRGDLRNGDPFQTVQVSFPTDGEPDAIRLLIWGAEKVAAQAADGMD